MSNDGRYRVLVVDDDEMVRDALADLLTEMAFEVAGLASNGAQGIEKALGLRPDVVLMDIRMPVMSGIDATRAIRDRWPDLAIVALSAYDDPALRAAARDAGARDYVVKGTDPGRLCDVIRRVAGREG
jgi:two-component system, NarL family, response regulator LiaR